MATYEVYVTLLGREGEVERLVAFYEGIPTEITEQEGFAVEGEPGMVTITVEGRWAANHLHAWACRNRLPVHYRALTPVR